MIRFAGALLIIAGTAAIGGRSALRYRNRVRSLESLVSALGIMQSEICDRLTPMPELLELLSAEAGKPASQLFRNVSRRMSELGARPFSDIWRQAVEDTPELLLSGREEACLSELGFSLGRYDVAQQRAALGYTARRMSDYAAAAERERASNSKLHAVFRIAAVGIIVAVLNRLLTRAGRDEQALMTTLAGLVIVLVMIIREIYDLFSMIKDLFGF